jgi:hypothetical protein
VRQNLNWVMDRVVEALEAQPDVRRGANHPTQGLYEGPSPWRLRRLSLPRGEGNSSRAS